MIRRFVLKSAAIRDRAVEAVGWMDWSTVIIRPSFWWRLRLLFSPHDLMFCWGDDKWFLVGFKDENFLAIGGVPTTATKNDTLTRLR